MILISGQGATAAGTSLPWGDAVHRLGKYIRLGVTPVVGQVLDASDSPFVQSILKASGGGHISATDVNDVTTYTYVTDLRLCYY